MPSKDQTTLGNTTENIRIKQNTASGNRIQPWKAFLETVNDGTALTNNGADDMIYRFKNGVQDNGIAS